MNKPHDITYDRKYLNAGEVWSIHVVGSSVTITEGDVSVDVQPFATPQPGESPTYFSKVPLLNGLGAPFGAVFDRLEITNGATAQWVSLYVSDVVIRDARTNLNITGTVTTEETIANSISAFPATVGTTSVGVLFSNTDTRRVTLQADLTNAGIVAITAQSSEAVTDGIQLAAGDSITLHTTATIRAIADTAGQVLRVIREFKS